MSFVEYCISCGYKPFRKVFDRKSRKWNYVECTDVNFFSSVVSGKIDIRLIKDDREIIFGIPGAIYDPLEGEKTHFPTLIYPNVFGTIQETDRAFKNIPFEEILGYVEDWFNKQKK